MVEFVWESKKQIELGGFPPTHFKTKKLSNWIISPGIGVLNTTCFPNHHLENFPQNFNVGLLLGVFCLDSFV